MQADEATADVTPGPRDDPPRHAVPADLPRRAKALALGTAEHPRPTVAVEPGLFAVVRTPAPPGLPTRVRFDVPSGVELRDAALDRVERSSREWQRTQVDEVLDELIRRGRPFSSNDVRPLLPADVRPALLGARFLASAKAGRIVRSGYEPSTSPRTHGHPVAVWQPVAEGGAE